MANSGNIKLLYSQIKTKEKLKNDDNTTSCESPTLSEHRDSTKAIFNPQINLEETNEHLTNVQCEICEKLISSKTNYLNHVKTHTADFYCNICCNSFTSQYKLNLHLSEHQGQDYRNKNTEAYIKCGFKGCDDIFPSKLQLFNHNKVHLNIKEVVCNICNAKFVRKSALESHERKHVVLSCAVCEKKFANKKTLKEHERLHTGELPFLCRQCGKKFRCHSGLKYHETKHSSEKKFRCNHCNLSFGRSNYLKDHLRRHLNEKPYTCGYCNRKFIQKNVLKRHVNNVHRSCDICKCTIGNVRDYRAHMYAEHDVAL